MPVLHVLRMGPQVGSGFVETIIEFKIPMMCLNFSMPGTALAFTSSVRTRPF
ncbi:MAG: hypothetical protein MUO68_24200 [Desulfobacteraceae bacterium]|nr:hypothetical protein [Desulfobacteraceae bacterium]